MKPQRFSMLQRHGTTPSDDDYELQHRARQPLIIKSGTHDHHNNRIVVLDAEIERDAALRPSKPKANVFASESTADLARHIAAPNPQN